MTNILNLSSLTILLSETQNIKFLIKIFVELLEY